MMHLEIIQGGMRLARRPMPLIGIQENKTAAAIVIIRLTLLHQRRSRSLTRFINGSRFVDAIRSLIGVGPKRNPCSVPGLCQADLDNSHFVTYKIQGVQKTEVFDSWLAALADQKAVARITSRIERLGMGNPGNVEPVGDGISEMKIDYGPGYREPARPSCSSCAAATSQPKTKTSSGRRN